MNNIIKIVAFVFLLAGCNSAGKSKEESPGNVVADTSSNTLPVKKEFHKKATFKRFTFTVDVTGDSDKNQFTLTPSGYSISNEPITKQVNGIIYDLLVSDIDGDENPEIAIILSSGEKQQGEALVYSSNKDRSLSQVNFPATIPDSVLTPYNGHDEFLFVGKNFVRRFPVEDNSGTRKLRHLQYRLVKGEAGKQLVLNNVIDL